MVDLFAGPGGLGEGFSAYDRGLFEVVLSVEKDAAAHQTLQLRSFFRQLGAGRRREYYRYLQGELTREELFRAHPDAADIASSRCLHLELGPRTTSGVYEQIERVVRGAQEWVLVGGPPCQAYSVVGRSRLARLGRKAFEQSEKHVLYREYLRILARYKPPVFVMENVQGLLSATYAGSSTFDRMISDLSSPTVAVRESLNGRKPLARRGTDYSILSFVHPSVETGHLRPGDYVIAAEKFGIPQRRHRVILLGVRSDLRLPSGLSLRPSAGPSVRDVLADLPPLRSQLSRKVDDRTLRDIDNRETIYFRVKVVDSSGEHGKILAEVDGIIPNPSDGHGARVAILEVKFEDNLGSQPWSLALSAAATPVLIVNKRLGNKEYIRSDDSFFSLVYPAVVREVLTRIIVIDECEYDPDNDEWWQRWLYFVCSLPDVGLPPGGEDNDAKYFWIDGAVKAFCEAQPTCGRFLDARSKEEAA